MACINPIAMLWALLAFLPGLIMSGCSSGTRIGTVGQSDEWIVARFVDPGAGRGAAYADLDFVDAQHGWVACLDPTVSSKLIRTTDGGLSWSERDAPVLQVDFVDRRVGWAVPGGRDRILRTTDGGVSWTPTSFTSKRGAWAAMLAGKAIVDLAAASKDEAWAIEGERLMHTSDAGRTWRAAAHPLAADQEFGFDAVFFLDRLHGWALGFRVDQDAAEVLVTTDGGSSFQVVRTPGVNRGSDGLYHIWFANTQEGWAAVDGSALLHSRDGGKTWDALAPEVDGGRLSATYHDCCFLTPQHGWAVGSVGSEALAIETQDGGRTWRRSLTGVEGIVNSKLRSVVFTDTAHGWVIGGGGIPPSDFPVQREEHEVAFLLKYQPRQGR